jgi:excisionase family DNA binding protein
MKRRNRQPESDPGDNESEVMTFRDVTRYLKCHRNTVYRLVRQGELPAFRVGSDWRFRRVDLKKRIEGQHVRPACIEASRPARYKRKS